MLKRLILLFITALLTITFTGCGYNEISKKLVCDAIIISNHKMEVIVENKEESKVFEVDFDTVENSVEEIKTKYDYDPYFSHSKEIIVSTEVTVKELSDIIQKFKFYYQISPDTGVALADENMLKALRKGDISPKKINTIVENKSLCDNRICSYDTIIKGKEFPVLFDKDGEIEVRKITL